MVSETRRSADVTETRQWECEVSNDKETLTISMDANSEMAYEWVEAIQRTAEATGMKFQAYIVTSQRGRARLFRA